MKINTQRTSITPLVLKHVPLIIEMYAEMDSNKFIAPLIGKTIDEYKDFLNGKIQKNKENVGFWSVFLKDTDEFIGTVNLNQFAASNIIHVGCHLKRGFWNKEFGFELMEALINYGFDNRKLGVIYAIIEVGHNVSNKLFESLGFKFVETKNIDGSELSFFSLTPTAWVEVNIDNFITVSTFVHPSDVYVIRGKLEANGIECNLKDELTVQVQNIYSNAIGGVKLQVRKSKRYEAINMLRDAGFEIEGEEEPSALWSKIDEITLKIPFLKKIPVELRLIILIMGLSLFILLLILSTYN